MANIFIHIYYTYYGSYYLLRYLKNLSVEKESLARLTNQQVIVFSVIDSMQSRRSIDDHSCLKAILMIISLSLRKG